MIRTGAQYREDLRDGREVFIDGDRLSDICVHPTLKPIVDIRARMCAMQHEPAHRPVLTYFADNERHSVFSRLLNQQRDWHDKRNAVDAVLPEIKGIVSRVGDVWPAPDLRAVRSDPAFQPPGGRLRRFRFFRAARPRAQCRRAGRQGQEIAMTRRPTLGMIS